MAKNKTLPANAGGQNQPLSQHNHPLNVSALSQQLEQVSIDQNRQTASPKRPSPNRKSKSDNGPGQSTGSGSDLPPSRTKNKRSPKSNNINGVKPQTPSRPTSMPPGPPPNSVVQTNGTVTHDLASHYAGPDFHSSPAPSSLPMPSFFASKQAKTALHSELDSPPNQFTPIKSAQSFDTDDSPLAPFFRADREEKNRLRNKYSTDGGVFGSPTLRPSSAGGLPEVRSESPLSWDSPQKGNNRFDARSELQRTVLADKQITRRPSYHFKWTQSLRVRIPQENNSRNGSEQPRTSQRNTSNRRNTQQAQWQEPTVVTLLHAANMACKSPQNGKLPTSRVAPAL
jgi:hypothetical protein